MKTRKSVKKPDHQKKTEKLIFGLLIFFGILIGTLVAAKAAFASSNSDRVQSESVRKAKNSRFKTKFDFDDLLVSGKYHYPDEAIATVEDDKLLSDLLDFRKEFKDRLSQSSSRH